MSDNITVEKVIEEHRASGKFFTVDGVQSFALDYGSGEAVFCIHGVPTSSFLYRKVLKELALLGLRGLAIDLPGLGLADRPENFDYSFPAFARFCALAAEELGLEKYHLVVHDIGGPIGFAMAAENKNKILSLTILNTFIDVVNFKKPLPMRPFEKPLLGEAQLAAILHPTWYLMFTSLGVVSTDGIPKEEIYTYVDLLKREDGGKAFLKIMRNFDHSEEFRELCYKAVQNVPYPIQAIWGEKDPALDFEHFGNQIKEAASLKEVFTVDSKHFLPEERWKEIAGKIATLAQANKGAN